MRRALGQLILLTGLVAAVTIPAQAASPTGGLNPCVVQAICVVIQTPGSPGAPGGTGGTGGTGGGSGGGATGEPSCTWNNAQYPCWDPDLGWFNTVDGCYYLLEVPQPPADDPSWGTNLPKDGSIYLLTCDNYTESHTEFLNKPPNLDAPPPTPATVGQMAFNELVFKTPTAHSAPVGQALVGVPVWLWYDTPNAPAAEVVGPQTVNVSLNGVSVDATATLTKVVWDLGYRDPATGQEATVECKDKGAGHPYAPGDEKKSPPPADACLAQFDNISSTPPSPPASLPASSPAASGAAAAGFDLVVTQYWTVSTKDMINGGEPWGPLLVKVSSAPLALQVNGLQLLN
ncbi:hypothetical protein OG455_06870 [Kitasatospora sp. NBC_01287]|uniref:hypothetical protein n=1 Tax=Kitasatospora sp. NBC_01287 TaxID=2903573 RepID=UPI002256FCB9|nr:hypothetical protein [Kitasatospora sp. NBC_01287]MCX4745246.1 hypothetical protein [Kitasatospora sp. NBC_01287]